MPFVATDGSTIFTRMSHGLRLRLLGLAVGNFLLIGYLFAYSQFHPETSFLREMSQFPSAAAPLLLAGLGLTGIIYTGGIDLSIGSIVVVCGTVFGILFQREFPPAACFAGCFLAAIVLSSLNGGLIRWLGIPAIIVTLGMLKFHRGLALVLASWHDPEFSGQFSIAQEGSEAFRAPGVEWAGWILLLGVAIALVLECHARHPRIWLAAGNSAEAFRLKGLNPERVKQSAFLAGGFFLGLAALIEVTKGLTIEPVRMAGNFELKVIGAVVLGGTNIFGGHGSYLGTLLGGCLLYFIEKVILYARIDANWQTAIQGLLILGVISLDCVLHRSQKRMEELQ
jgi:ribose/xylose/arabinose/galactoside ABC-type transport system permease subunit